MTLKNKLQSVPPAEWVTRKAIFLGWHDGPCEGVCALVRPAVEFYFELQDERYNPDGLDDRLFRLKELPAGSVDSILASMTVLSPPDQPLWIPNWTFPDKIKQQEVENRLKEILSQGEATWIFIATRDMEHFDGCWSIDSNGNGALDSFVTLGISQKHFAGGVPQTSRGA